MTAPPPAAPPPSDGHTTGTTAPGTPGAPDGLEVPLHRGWIAAAMILFWPLALAAVLAANRAARARGAGDLATAHREAQGARAHARLAVLIGAVGSALGLALDITLVVVGVQYGPGLLGRVVDLGSAAGPAPETYRSAAAPEREPITVDPFMLQPGDCFTIPDDELVWEGIDVIPCSRLHDGLVIGVTEHLRGDFPGEEAIAEAAWADCWAWYDSYSGTIGSEDSPVWTFDPILADWADGVRTSVCFIEAPFPVEGKFSDYPEIFETGVDA